MFQINELLGNKKTISILLFFLDSSIEYSQTELIGKVGLAKATAVRSLKLLVESKALSVRKIGPTNLYSLNHQSEFVIHIKAIKALSEEKNA